MTIKDTRENFNKMNKLGAIGEDAFLAYLDKHNYEVLHRSYGYAPEGDVYFRNREGVINLAEVKTDSHPNSKNLVFEIHSRGRASGICSGSSDWYITYCVAEQSFYIADRRKLLHLTLEHPELFTHSKNKRNDSKTYLLKMLKTDFLKHFTKHPA